MTDILKQTYDGFETTPDVAHGTKREAKTGDRIVLRSMAGISDVFEVILVKKKDVIAVCLGGHGGTDRGEKMRLPKVWSNWPTRFGEFDASLYFKPVVAAATEQKPARAPRQRPADGQPSKISVCRALYAANASLTREQMIELFVKEGKCTPMGAVTYFSTCKKG